MVCQSSTFDNSLHHSNSQSAQYTTVNGQLGSSQGQVDSHVRWSGSNSAEQPQGSLNQSLNQIPLQGAKSAHSEIHSSLQQAPSYSQFLMSDCHLAHLDMQSSVQNKVDSTPRYNNDVPASHAANGGGSFMPGYQNSMFRSVGSNGAHSNTNHELLTGGANSDTNASYSQGLSFGAQYNSSGGSGRTKTQGSDPNVNTSYSGWQGLNSSATSVPSSNGWIVQNSSSAQKSGEVPARSQENPAKEGIENMVVDNDMSFSNLISATSTTEGADEKQAASNNNDSRGKPARLYDLMNNGLGGWNGGQSSLTGTSVWENNQQMSGNPDSMENNSDMMMDNHQSRFSGLIGATGGSDYADTKQHGNGNNFKQDPSHLATPRLGLLGGGETSLNAPSSWGGPSQATGGNSSGWVTGNRSNNDKSGSNGMSPPKAHGSWAQAAGKGLNPTGPSSGASCGATSAPPNTDTRPQSSDGSGLNKVIEEATEFQIMAANSVGWGTLSVNQETSWAVPPSPPLPDINTGPMLKDGRPPSQPPMWRAQVNNGTEIWENNLRMNKGIPAPAAPAAPPWGHTPSTNIGGHWGEDESSNNMWNNAPSQQAMSGGGGPTSWKEQNPSGQAGGGGGGSGGTWGNNNPTPVPEKNWSDDRGAPWYDDGGNMPEDIYPANPSMNWSPGATLKKEGHPSGWELPSPPPNRRSMNADDGTAVWGNPQQQGKVSHWKEMPAAKSIMNSGNGFHNSGMNPMQGGMTPSGPGMIRLPSGATVGGKNEMWNKTGMNRNNSWQDMPPSREGPSIGTWGDEPVHMGNPGKNMSGSSNVSNFGGEWVDQNSPMAGYWGAKPRGGQSSNWADGQVDTSSWLGPSKQGGKPLTRDLIWASKQFRLLIEMNFKKDDAENALRNNNMNFNDALMELRANHSMDNNLMDIDGYSGPPGRKVRSANPSEDINMSELLDPPFSGGNYHGSGGFQGSGNFQGMGAFKQVKVPGQNNSASLLNSGLGGQQPNIGSMNNFSPVLFQKILQQQQQQQQQQNPLQQFGVNMQQLNRQNNQLNQGNFPSMSHLRHLMQQIQMAVQAGHLNPQILQQALAPQTLLLLYQLLQQIKVLAQLQQHIPKTGGNGGPNNALQINYQITQTKQRILSLQNQISSQQTLFLKQQQQQSQPNHGLHVPQNSSTESFKPNFEPVPSLHNNFGDLSIKDVREPMMKDQSGSYQAPSGQQQQQQSRFANVWKSYEKEDSSSNGCQNSGGSFGNEFSRAPGPSKSSSSSSAIPSSGPNMHTLLGTADGAWSSLSRPQGESGGWPETATSLTGLIDNASGSSSGGLGSSQMPLDTNKEPMNTPPSSGPSTNSASHSTYNLTDLVPEFEPGKPWKGNQMKNIEDDPHITPGSIVRSPLSVNTIKDSDLFWNSKANPTTTSSSEAPGSTPWIFTPSNTAVTNSPTGLINKPVGGKSNWSTGVPDSTSADVWSPSLSKSRGPPPGLTAQGWDQQTSSTFLLLRNLTPQIDGSTLKTLCMQHGPLQLFHLNHGSAIARYNSREEASKAQSALNNCVLANTTILANIPNEAEIQQYLGQLSNQNGASTTTNNWPTTQHSTNASSSSSQGFRAGSNASSYSFSSSSGNGGGSGASASKQQSDPSSWNGNNLNMPSQLWSYPNASSTLWGSTQPIGDPESSTNASLNRFLPDNLLGGESM